MRGKEERKKKTIETNESENNCGGRVGKISQTHWFPMGMNQIGGKFP